VNTGRRKIVINSIGGRYKKEHNSSKYFVLALTGLPKMIEPYEVFSQHTDISSSLLREVAGSEIDKIWIEDTKGKKWSLKKKEMKILKDTANYINNGKHLI